MRQLFLLLLSFPLLFGVEKKPKSEVNKSNNRNKVVVKRLYGIIINGSSSQVPEYVTEREDSVSYYSCMQIINEKKKQEFKGELQKQFIGKSLTLAKIQEIKDEVQKFYKNNGQSLVVVQVNEQDITDGVLVVTVIEARRGDLIISGNQHFDTEFYQDQIQVERDQIIENGKLMQDIEWINRNPYRKANCTLKPGKNHATTDIILNIREVKPLRVFFGVDNTGFKITDFTRFFVGVNAGGFFDDHLLSLQYIASPDFHDFQGIMFQYTFGAYERDLLTISGGYSSINPKPKDLMLPVHHGESWLISPRYIFTSLIPKLWPNIAQDVEVGFDFKRTNNNFTVGELTYYKSLISIFQFAGCYNFNYEYPNLLIDAKAEAFFSPGKITSSMSKSAYGYLRSDADNCYLYLRFASTFDYYIDKGVDVRLKFRGQLSTATLLPIEQYGLGGVNSVRGYVDRAVNADNALLANAELIGPPMTFLWKKKPYFKVKDIFRVHVFLDGGVGFQNSNLEYEKQSQSLVGVGLGFRYNIGSAVNLRFDTGYPCTSLQNDNYVSRAYFSLTCAF